MSDTNWRTWAYQRLSQDAAFTALVPVASIYGAGSITEPPQEKPFCVIKLGAELPGPFPGVSRQRVALYVHDEPGDYLAIGTALAAARTALIGAEGSVGQVVALGAVACAWQGDGPDLADPDFGTIFRTSDYDLHGRNGNA